MFKIDNLKQAVGVNIAIGELMTSALTLWDQIYRNQASWLNKDVHSLNLGASIASELARVVTIELKAEITGSSRADYLMEQFKKVLSKIRVNTEYAAAKGGLAMKPYMRGNQLGIDFIQADMLYPLAFDSNGNMTGAVFADQRTIYGNIYTRLETHMLLGVNYKITNTAYVSRTVGVLGSPVNLTSVPDWTGLAPEATILNIERPLFAYFKMPFANNIDSTSPLGVSIYSRAAQFGRNGKSLLQIADLMFSGFNWELESGERALYVDKLAFDKDAEGKQTLAQKRLHRMVDMQSKIDSKGFYEDWTPEIRDDKYLNSIDAVKRCIEFVCGLSYGVISNPQAVALTATEIKNSQQRYYSTVTDTQKSLENAFNDLLYAMDIYCTLYDLAPSGNYQAVYSFDDSIVADHDTQFSQDMLVKNSGMMSGARFLVRNYKLSDADASKWITEAQAETPPVDFFNNANAGV